MEEIKASSPKNREIQVYRALVDELCGPPGTTIPALSAGLIIAGVSAYVERRPAFYVVLGLMVLMIAVRLTTLALYRAVPQLHETEAQLRRWEKTYGVMAILWAMTLGTDCSMTMLSDSTAMKLFAVTMTIGMTSGIAARFAALPWISLGQILSVLGPYCGVLLAGGAVQSRPAAVGLMVMTMLAFVSVWASTKKINKTMLGAMRSARHNAFLRNRFDTALNNMSHGIVMFDRDKTLEVANERFRALFQIADGRIEPGATFHDVVEACTENAARSALSPEERETMLIKAIDSREETSRTILRGDGSLIDFTFHPTTDGGTVIVMEDITEKTQVAAKIEHLAHYDSLTGLANRVMFGRELETTVNRAIESETTFSVLMLDLDGFKKVNDTLGHPVGDKLLVEVAERLKTSIRGSDQCFRIGGDEFVAICQTRNDEHTDCVAKRLIETISKPYVIEKKEIRIGTSIGVSRFDRDGRDGKELVKKADIALYVAKDAGRGTWKHFLPAMNAEAEERRDLEGALRHAIEIDAIDLHYQPIVNPIDGRIASCEALLRWYHPSKGLVRPDKAIKIAEDTGLIVDLGALILVKACREAATWENKIDVAVNLSALQFSRGVVVRQIETALRESGLEPHRLEVEITESLAVGNFEQTRRIIDEIRALGVKIALDDFGTGYSSLSYLHQIPFDKVKIDRSFVLKLGTDENAMAESLIKLIADFVGSLGKKLVIEGVETLDQCEIIERLGGRLIQGYFFSKPRPVAEVRTLVAFGMIPKARPATVGEGSVDASAAAAAA